MLALGLPRPYLSAVQKQLCGIECAALSFDFDFLITPKALAEKLEVMEEEHAAVAPLLDAAQCDALARSAKTLTYRPAQPVVGAGAQTVYQDFSLCYDLPQDSVFRLLAKRLEHLLCGALALTRPRLLVEPFLINDLIVQHYPAGCKGITPHRDHLRYRGLVALVILAGAGDFSLCRNRQGDDPKPLASAKGDLLLMRAPGFGGSEIRPFHYLADIRTDRLSFGCRHDVRSGSA